MADDGVCADVAEQAVPRCAALCGEELLGRLLDFLDVDEAGFQPPRTARTVQVRDGEATVESRPVISTADVIADFYVIDVARPNEAVQWAERIPTAIYGQVEVRPIVEFEG